MTVIKQTQVCPSPQSSLPIPDGRRSGKNRGKKRAASKKLRRRPKKGKKRAAAKKMSKHQRILAKNRRKRRGLTIAQCIVMAIKAFGKKKGMTFGQIRTCLTRMDIKVSSFVMKKVLGKMKQWRVVKTTKANARHYKLTGRRCPTHIQNKKVNKRRNKSKAQKRGDRKFRNKMRRVAHKIARGGRTMEKCCNDVLKARKSMTMLKMLDYLNKHGIVCSKFVLKHVLTRLRGKKVVKCIKGYYCRTGKRMPRKRMTKAQRASFAAKMAATKSGA